MNIRNIILFSLLVGVFSQSYASEGLSFEKSQMAITAAFTKAKESNSNLSCAIVDARGDVVIVARMDGARFFTTTIAEGKALASAISRRPSGALDKMAGSSFFAKLNETLQNRMIPTQGAMPIKVAEIVVGGMGCSGASPQTDEDVATAGLAAFE